MSLYAQEKVNNFRIFSPRLDNTSRKLDLSYKKNIGNFNEYSKFSNIGNTNPINLYYSPKNITSPKNSRIPKIYSPLHKKLNRLYRSSSQNDMSRPLSCNTRALPSVQSFSSINSPKTKTKNNRIKNKRQNFFNLEKEKLYQETYQIKKVVKVLMKKLYLLKQENYQRDKQINTKQKKINDIINNNNDSLNENNYLYINNNNNNSFNDFSMNSSISDNMSVNSNFNIFKKKNTPTLNLIAKIKKAINKITEEIKEETEKYENLKKSLFLTKMNELKTESILLEEQIKKINTFINKAFVIEEENNKKKNEYLKFKESINKQKELITTLEERANMLDKEEVELKEELKIFNSNIKNEHKKINLNKNKLNILLEKNNNLSNDKNLSQQTYTIKINNNLIEIKSFYTSEISKLNKLINFFIKQNKYSDNEIKKLNELKKKLLGTEKENKTPKIEYFSSNKNAQNVTDIEKINNLKKTLKDSNEIEKKLKKRLTIYTNKLKELENVKDPNDIPNQSQIEFGIDNDNPYYIDDSKNIPEMSNKFTSSQFNQFTYILFKNFESKGISFEESRDKVINKFIEFNKNNIIDNISFPSKEFDIIVDGYTKIIMEILNCNNKYNYTLTHIFISALLFNSECNVNKLIEYFNVLFSYTRNYKSEEEKFILKLKSKYKQQTEKLINCLKDSILNDSNSSKYFHLLKMKDLLEQNEINLKDKYIEFLFYYMKKFDDPEAKLGDLNFTLLNNIIPIEYFDKNNSHSNHINIINGEDENINININENNNDIIKDISNSNSKIKEEENVKKMDNNNNNKNKKEKKKEKIIDNDDDEFKINDKKSVTDENFSKKSKKMNTDNKDNSDDIDDEDSMTEITNEEYIKQLTEAIALMQGGLKEANTNFDELMSNVVQKRKLNGIFYECITIEDFNDQLKSINVVLSDLKLSCLCSKYSIPNELRLIDKNKIEKDIEKHIKGTLKLDEEENDNDNDNNNDNTN